MIEAVGEMREKNSQSKRNGNLLSQGSGVSSGGRGRSFSMWGIVMMGLILLGFIVLAGVLSHSLAVSPVDESSTFRPVMATTSFIATDTRGEQTATPSPLLDGTLEKWHGAEVVWQIPSNPTGVLFLAHGCHHRANHFWDRSTKCPTCYGWPEERNLTMGALSLQFAVISISSADVCWDAKWPPEYSADVRRVVQILQEWRTSKGLENLPLYGFGASSGGYFVSVLAHRVKFTALAVQIATGVRTAFEKNVSIDGVTMKYPPTLFMQMPFDHQIAAGVKASMGILRGNGVATMDVKSNPRPITPYFFAERISGIDASLSLQIYQSLKKAGHLNEDGFLVHNPRRFAWKSLLRDEGVLPEESIQGSGDEASGAPTKSTTQLKFERDISEELNVAFGQHELFCHFDGEMFDWFLDVCRHGSMQSVPTSGRCSDAETINKE